MTSTVNKTLLARQLIQNQGNCTKFKVSRDMCDKMRSKDKYTLDKHESEVIETIRNLYGEEINEEKTFLNYLVFYINYIIYLFSIFFP